MELFLILLISAPVLALWYWYAKDDRYTVRSSNGRYSGAPKSLLLWFIVFWVVPGVYMLLLGLIFG